MEAVDDITSETNGILQDLLLALVKVRRTDLQGREVTFTRQGDTLEQGALLSYNGQERTLGETRLCLLVWR